MACRVYRDKKTNEIKKVLAPNGEPSSLFLRLFTMNKGDKELSLLQWADAHMNYANELNAQGEPNIDPKIYAKTTAEDLVETPSRGEDVDIDLDNARSNLPDDLKALQSRSKQWTTKDDTASDYKEGDEHYYHAVKGTAKVSRTTGDRGPLNAMRATPFNLSVEERAQKAAESKWGKRPAQTTLDTEIGKMDMEEYIKRKVEDFKMFQARGNILHKYMQIHAAPKGSADRQRLEKELSDMFNETSLNPRQFAWLFQGNVHKTIFAKAGLNIYNPNVPTNQKHKILSEVTVVEDKYLGWGGTIDLLFKNPASGNYSLRDFKSGNGFNKELTSAMFKYGVQNNISITQTPRNTAKLQLMLYALIMKINNPDTKFDSLEITWVPSRTQIGLRDHKKRVEVEDFLGMIRQYLENEQPDKFKALKDNMTEEQFKRLFDPTEYEQDYEANTKARIKQANLKAELEMKLQKLKELTMFNITGAAQEGTQYESQTKSMNKQAKVLFEDVLRLSNDIGWKPEEYVRDIGFLSMWLASNASQNSPYIQLYDKLLRAQKTKALARIDEIKSKEKPLLDEVQNIYWQVYGKPFTESIPVLKGVFANVNYEKMWGWMYVDIIDKEGNKLGRKIRTKPEEWAQLHKEGPYTEAQVESLKKYADFQIQTYNTFFQGKNALANKMATYRHKFSEDTYQMEMLPVSNLELHNEWRASNNSSAFQYQEGWFPKVPKTLEEYGYIWDKGYRDELWRRNLTLHHEDVFEQEFNEVEVIPFKYLGSDYIQASENYSINAEINFDKFIRNAILKEELEQVYAFGRGIQIYLKAKGFKKGSADYEYKNTINYLETALESQVRGRRQMKLPGGFLERNGSFIRTADGNRVYMVDWVKVIRTFKMAAAAPIMWLKPLAGAANGIFTYMFTLKEAIKNDIIRSGRKGSFIGINGDEVDFGVKDLAKATKLWWGVQVDAMTGNLKNNKMFRVAKRLGYMPASTRSTEYSNFVTTRNKIFDSSTMYMFHRIPEEAVAMITMTAQLQSMKTADGKSMWDHYDLVDMTDEQGNAYKEVQWDGYIRGQKRLPDGSLEDLAELDANEMRMMYYVYERMHGGYREDERARLEYYLFGELFMQFRRYLPNILKQAFGSKRRAYAYGSYQPVETYKTYKAEEEQISRASNQKPGDPQRNEQIVEWSARVQEGRYKVLGGLIASALPIMAPLDSQSEQPTTIMQKLAGKVGYYQHESYQWKNLDPWQREVVVDAVVTMTMMGLMAAAGVMIFANADDDNALKKYYTRIMMNFGQHWNVYELSRELLSNNAWPAAPRQAWGFMEASTKLLWASSLYATGFEEQALTQRGDLRGWNNFKRHTRILSSIYEIEKVWEGYESGDMDKLFDFRLRR